MQASPINRSAFNRSNIDFIEDDNGPQDNNETQEDEDDDEQVKYDENQSRISALLNRNSFYREEPNNLRNSYLNQEQHQKAASQILEDLNNSREYNKYRQNMSMTSINKDIMEAKIILEKNLISKNFKQEQQYPSFKPTQQIDDQYEENEPKSEMKVYPDSMSNTRMFELEQQNEDVLRQFMNMRMELDHTKKRAEQAEDIIQQKDLELQRVQETNTTVVNEYEKILQQLTQECNNQVSLNENLQNQLLNHEADKLGFEREV